MAVVKNGLLEWERPSSMAPKQDQSSQGGNVIRCDIRKDLNKQRCQQRRKEWLLGLGRVDKYEPVSDGSEMAHAEEAVGQLVVGGNDGAVDLEMAGDAFDAIDEGRSGRAEFVHSA